LETDFFTCDPAGVCFEDTLGAIDVKVRDSSSRERWVDEISCCLAGEAQL